jgi:TRAP-type C4-dicarboxylate transport system permease small subunit
MRRFAFASENVLATAALGGIMLLPLTEIVVRRFFGTGIPGAGPFAQNLTLWVGLLGAAIAAREGKLLTLATGEFLPKGAVTSVAHVLGAFVGAAVAMIFAVGGYNLMMIEREAGDIIAADVPVWISTIVFPVALARLTTSRRTPHRYARDRRRILHRHALPDVRVPRPVAVADCRVRRRHSRRADLRAARRHRDVLVLLRRLEPRRAAHQGV